MKQKLFTFTFLLAFSLCWSQDSINYKRRLNIVRYGGLATYTVGMIGLSQLWYSDSPHTSFHWFNDAAEWKQMDKAGHVFSSFQLSSTTYQALKWANSKEKKRAITSSLVGFTVISSIELFDGFSEAYGASATDLLANAAGATFFLGQSLLWKEIRIHPKFSFHQTEYAALRPEVLGDGLASEMFKDYNGQTYWLSTDLDKFMRFPKWLNLAVGYGAEGMVYARDEENIAAGYPEAYRQFYLSIDFDLTAIPTRSKFLKGVIFFANMIKLPAPTLEFSKNGVKAYAFYF